MKTKDNPAAVAQHSPNSPSNQQQPQQAQELPPLERCQAAQVYDTPKGKFIRTGNGWKAAL